MSLSGFTPPTPAKRLFWEVMGREKIGGKTDFTLWSPEPIAFLDLERRIGQVRPSVLQRNIISKQYFDGDIFEIMPKHGVNPELQTQAAKYLEEIDTDFKDACRSRDIRSVVLDSGSIYHRICTLAQFGRLGLEADKSYLYGIRNQHIENLLTFARTSDKTVIWTHRVKQTYVKDEDTKREVWSGEWEREGYNKAGHLFDIGIFTRFDPEERVFKAKVLYSTVNMAEQYGVEYDLPEEDSYAYLASLITGTEIEEWQ